MEIITIGAVLVAFVVGYVIGLRRGSTAAWSRVKSMIDESGLLP